MKKVSFRVRNFDKEQFLTYNIDNEADLDEEVLDFLEEEEPSGIVPIIFDDEDESYDTFSYDITDKIHLTELSNQEINAEMVLMVMRGIVISLMNMAEYRIPLSYLVLHRNYIYIDSDYKVEFICIPLEEMQEEVDINGFLRSFLSSLRFDSADNGDYVARLFTYINNPAIFTLHNLLTLVENLMENYGIEIPDDNESGIYVDYQEVDETEEDEESEEEPEEISGEATIFTAEDKEETFDDTGDESVMESEEESVEETLGEEAGETAEELVDEPIEEPVEEALEEITEESEEMSMEESGEDLDVAEEEPEEAVVNTTEEPDPVEEAKDLINKITQQVMDEKETPEEKPKTDEDASGKVPDKKKKSTFKTKAPTVTGVVIHDELDDFLAEKEEEEKKMHKEESGIKMKKAIKVNRASIVKSNQEEQKSLEEAGAESGEAATGDNSNEESGGAALNQTVGTAGTLKGASDVPKANPYLIRVNTNERIVITKQTFKIGKASMGVDYTVQGNGAVSRVHAILTSRDDVYYIKDNKSTNRTYVNGKALGEGEEQMLTHDSKIMLGDEEFIFKLR